jgi:predicted RNase H-like HicB family nuclease
MEVIVEYHNEEDTWWAESPNVPGWSATAENVDELRQLVREGLLYALENPEPFTLVEVGLPARSEVYPVPAALFYESMSTAVRSAIVTFDYWGTQPVSRPELSGVSDPGLPVSA